MGSESRMIGARQAVSAMVERDRAAQRKINIAVDRDIKRITDIADKRHSESVRARGVLRKIFDQNKKIAAAEMKALRKKTQAQLIIARAEAAAHKRKFAKDLTAATKKLNGALMSRSAAQAQRYESLKKKLTYTKAATASQLAAAKKAFNSRIVTLTNVVVSNSRKFQKKLKRITGVAMDWKKASAADRKAIRVQRNGMFSDLNKALARAIQLGEAKGLGYGASKLPMIFSGKVIKVKKSVSKINGLVAEYMSVLKQVRERFPIGLGNYLMAKLETSMQGTGALEVDKIADRSGNYVFVNGHAVGLSSKLSDFATLAVHGQL